MFTSLTPSLPLSPNGSSISLTDSVGSGHNRSGWGRHRYTSSTPPPVAGSPQSPHGAFHHLDPHDGPNEGGTQAYGLFVTHSGTGGRKNYEWSVVRVKTLEGGRGSRAHDESLPGTEWSLRPKVFRLPGSQVLSCTDPLSRHVRLFGATGVHVVSAAESPFVRGCRSLGSKGPDARPWVHQCTDLDSSLPSPESTGRVGFGTRRRSEYTGSSGTYRNEWTLGRWVRVFSRSRSLRPEVRRSSTPRRTR